MKETSRWLLRHVLNKLNEVSLEYRVLDLVSFSFKRVNCNTTQLA